MGQIVIEVLRYSWLSYIVPMFWYLLSIIAHGSIFWKAYFKQLYLSSNTFIYFFNHLITKPWVSTIPGPFKTKQMYKQK